MLDEILAVLSRIHLIKCGFFLMAFGTLLLGLLVNYCEPLLPAFLTKTFQYGKFLDTDEKSIVTYFQVPKSWFKHFYVVATLYSALVLILATAVYVFFVPVPEAVHLFLDLVSTSTRRATVNITVTYLVIVLFSLQTWKRFHETFFVSVYSNSKINVIHYIVGIAHYIGALTAIIAEAPIFAALSFKHKLAFSLEDIGLNGLIGTAVFLWAWWNQYKCAVILANLRKDSNGSVVTYDHKLPAGGLFDLVSSPHMFCEMLMYFGLGLILWEHTTWAYVFWWVFINQCEMALLNHWWYQSKFKGYPERRKAFLPFIL